MKMFKDFFKNRSLGFYVALGAALLAIFVSIVYLVCYVSIYKDKMDRVFSLITLIFTLSGGLIILIGELFRLDFVSMVGPVLIAVGLAKHSVEAAYPIADMGTGVAFFGGNQTFAVLFMILIGVAFIIAVASTFMEHNKKQ